MASKASPFLFSIFFFFLGLHSCAGQTANVKAVYWFPDSEFPVSSIDSTLFTHIFCAFADLNNITYQVTISSANEAQFKNFTQTVQQKNPNVKTLLSIGGGGANEEAANIIKAAFSSMASQASRRKSFIDSSINLARSNNFHGLDLDWENLDTAVDYTNFGTLLNEWRTAIANEARISGKPTLLLTAAVFRSSNYGDSLNYPVQSVSDNLDWINVMSYDFYGPGWSPNFTAPPAALYSGASGQVNGDAGISDWIQSGVAARKIVLGLPFYGYAWRLVNSNNHGLFAPANGSAISGGIGYGQIRTFISQNEATAVYNGTVVTDYAYSGTTWIGYDDTQSVSTKVSYAKGKGLLGYFAWHVGADSNWVLSQTASRTWGA
ncbi:class V chitinase [Ziziphus jujuba]|uniref:Class V chitinase n=1 Tax=Ziziphus jujuba TaxID=326968 RepID=A0A6P4AEJ2_ZIZJJ|nr:class V chitinase [Ziziphus jujuba]